VASDTIRVGLPEQFDPFEVTGSMLDTLRAELPTDTEPPPWATPTARELPPSPLRRIGEEET
jgi:hypothetical protein